LPRPRFLQDGADVEVSPACEDGSRATNEHPLISDAWKAFNATLTTDNAEDKCELTITNAVTMTCNLDYRQIVTDLNLEQTCLDNGGMFLDLNVVFGCTTNQMGAEINLNLDMKSISPLCLAQVCLAEIEEYKAFVEALMIENVSSDGNECFDSTFDFKVIEGIEGNTLAPVPAPTLAPTLSPVSGVTSAPIMVTPAPIMVSPAPVAPIITPSPVDTSPTPPAPLTSPSTDSAAGITKMSLVVGTIFIATLMVIVVIE